MFHVKHSYVGKRGFSSQIAPYPAAFPPPQHLFAPRAIPPLTQCRRRLSAAVMQAATSFSLASHAAQVHLSCKMFHVKHSYASNDNATPRSPTQATAAAPPSPAPPPPCPLSPLAPSPINLRSPSTRAYPSSRPCPRTRPPSQLSHQHVHLPFDPSAHPSIHPRSPPTRTPPTIMPSHPPPHRPHAQPSAPHRPHAQPSVPHRPSQPERPRARQPSLPECSHAICLRNPEDWTKVLYI